ncbi:MAG: phosphatase PAP2 family protein [Candidatus Poseidoniaceae archaeon]
MEPYTIMMLMIVILTPIICWLFTRHRPDMRVPWRQWARTFHDKRYYVHALGYLAIIKWKKITDTINEPIKMKTGHWTELVYSIEGDFTKWIQDAFQNDVLTDFLNFHYLFVYLFLIYVTTVYFAFTDDRDMADKVALNYLLIYALAVPYYLFFNVEVTSSWIPNMDALLYHDGWYSSFYALHDPLDNAVPSLHVAIPFGILYLNYLHVKEKGIKMSEWRHWPYHVFIAINTLMFIFTILYLGIHWFIDIPLGIIIGGIGALFIHHLQPRLRNDFGPMFKGVTRKKVWRHVFAEGVAALLLLTVILMSVNIQSETVDSRVSYQLGADDSTFEIIQEFEPGSSVSSNLTNLHDSIRLEVVVLIVEMSEPAMEDGSIDWEIMKTLGDYYTVEPQSTLMLEIDTPNNYHLIIMHNPGNSNGSSENEVIQVRIINDYHEDIMWKAVLLSLPSLWITGFVIHRLYRLKKYKRSLIDSTPSHLWEQEIMESE